MRNVIRGFFLLILMLSLVSCKKDLRPDQIPAHIAIGDSYYTQFVIRYEKSAHITTNYRRGASIPVNTKVQLMKITPRTIEVTLDNASKPLLIKNAEKHTGDDIYQAFDKLFGTNPVDLAQFTAPEKKQISSGTVAKGMRKKAVLVAIGYPPITETMSLDVNTWVYWSHRYNRFNVNFTNDRVSSIVD